MDEHQSENTLSLISRTQKLDNGGSFAFAPGFQLWRSRRKEDVESHGVWVSNLRFIDRRRSSNDGMRRDAQCVSKLIDFLITWFLLFPATFILLCHCSKCWKICQESFLTRVCQLTGRGTAFTSAMKRNEIYTKIRRISVSFENKWSISDISSTRLTLVCVIYFLDNFKIVGRATKTNGCFQKQMT